MLTIRGDLLPSQVIQNLFAGFGACGLNCSIVPLAPESSRTALLFVPPFTANNTLLATMAARESHPTPLSPWNGQVKALRKDGAVW